MDGAADALGLEVAPRALTGREEDVGETVGLDAVALLGHVVAPRPQAGLDVHQRQPGGDRRAGARERGVRVAADDDRVRALLGDHGGEARLGELHLLLAPQRADAEVVAGTRRARYRGSAPRTCGRRSAGPCGTRISSASGASAAETGAAWMISGRAPMIEMRRGRRSGMSVLRRGSRDIRCGWPNSRVAPLRESLPRAVEAALRQRPRGSVGAALRASPRPRRHRAPRRRDGCCRRCPWPGSLAGSPWSIAADPGFRCRSPAAAFT